MFVVTVTSADVPEATFRTTTSKQLPTLALTTKASRSAAKGRVIAVAASEPLLQEIIPLVRVTAVMVASAVKVAGAVQLPSTTSFKLPSPN